MSIKLLKRYSAFDFRRTDIAKPFQKGCTKALMTTVIPLSVSSGKYDWAIMVKLDIISLLTCVGQAPIQLIRNIY